MPVEFRPPAGNTKGKAKLTPLGMAAVALVALLAGAVIFMLAAGAQRRAALEARAEVIDAAVAHAVAVCESTAAALGDENDADEVALAAERIAAESDPLTRAGLAGDLIGRCLRPAAGRPDLIDELNGARNRIQVAVREYNAK